MERAARLAECTITVFLVGPWPHMPCAGRCKQGQPSGGTLFRDGAGSVARPGRGYAGGGGGGGGGKALSPCRLLDAALIEPGGGDVGAVMRSVKLPEMRGAADAGALGEERGRHTSCTFPLLSKVVSARL